MRINEKRKERYYQQLQSEFQVLFLDPAMALDALDGLGVAIVFEDGTEEVGELVCMRHDKTELGRQLFALVDGVTGREIVRTFIGNVRRVTVL